MTGKVTKEQRALIYAEARSLGEIQSKAYIKAFPDSKANKKNLNTTASRYEKTPAVQQKIKELSGKQVQNVDKTLSDAGRQLVNIAFADVGSFLDENGEMKPLEDIDPDIMRAVNAIDFDTVNVITKTKDGGEIINPKMVIRRVRLENRTQALSKFIEYKLSEEARQQEEEEKRKLVDGGKPVDKRETTRKVVTLFQEAGILSKLSQVLTAAGNKRDQK